MNTLLVIVSLIDALMALGRGQWGPLLIFNLVGILFGTEYIPHAFSLLAAFNVAWLLYFLRRKARAGHAGGHEQRGLGPGQR